MLIPAAQLKNVLNATVGSLERFSYAAMILHFTGIFIIYLSFIRLQKRVLMNLLWSPWVWGPGWQCMAETSPHLWRWGQASWRKGRPQNCECLRQSLAAAPHPWSWEYSWRFLRRNGNRNVTILNYYTTISLIIYLKPELIYIYMNVAAHFKLWLLVTLENINHCILMKKEQRK